MMMERTLAGRVKKWTIYSSNRTMMLYLLQISNTDVVGQRERAIIPYSIPVFLIINSGMSKVKSTP
jgi:hypothetical protein